GRRPAPRDGVTLACVEPAAAPPRDEPGPLEPDPVIEAYKAGVDRTLLRENLKRSPTERLANLAALQRLAEELRRAGRAARSSADPVR
ncbi:MAG TPA: hypothetical protein VNM66_05655, partial [Thermodesulfobacteriota bacterium]|nr:hypothetical protein [Thermodesulfobacteriota bacterium]